VAVIVLVNCQKPNRLHSGPPEECRHLRLLENKNARALRGWSAVPTLSGEVSEYQGRKEPRAKGWTTIMAQTARNNSDWNIVLTLHKLIVKQFLRPM